MIGRCIRIAAPAKVNLRLRVLARETSGYHSLETIFAGVSLYDEIEIEPGPPGVTLEVGGRIDTGPTERNLAVRAASRFFEETGIGAAVTIRLEKRIPAAAGLGGGSSDAAATLRALNAWYGAPCSSQTLLEIGAELGSDIPFFLTPTPFALAWGRGERLLALEPPAERQILIANPGIPISTPAAFIRHDELRGAQPAQPPEIFSIDALRDWTALERLAHNDLYPAALERLPRLQEAERILRDAGARICLLSGSGPSIFAIFESGAPLLRIADEMTGIGFRSWPAATLDEWPSPVWRD